VARIKVKFPLHHMEKECIVQLSDLLIVYV